MSDTTKNIKQPEIDFPEDNRLFNIAIWSGTIGWLVLILGLVQNILQLVRMFQSGFYTPLSIQLHPLETIIMIFSFAQPILYSIILWFFLQALKEFLFLMIDIKETMQPGSVED